MSNNETSKYIELESKFKMELTDLLPFKELVQSMNPDNFLYIEGPDYYFTKEDGDTFIRYRVPLGSKGDGQLTMKKKTNNNNNVIRIELNVDVINMNLHKATKFAEMLDFKLNFQINKQCHIYMFSDAIVCFYTVTSPGNKEPLHALEIEVKEEKVDELGEEASMEILRSYEKKFEALGISAQRRLKKSLFEMYRK